MAPNTRSCIVIVNMCFVGRKDRRQLIIKRSPTDKNNADKWEMPGGKVDDGQGLAHAQEHEVMEETELLAQPIQSFVFADSFVIGTGQYRGLPYVVLFSITRLVGDNIAISEERTNHAWVTYDELLSYDLTHEVRKATITLKSHLPVLTRIVFPRRTMLF